MDWAQAVTIIFALAVFTGLQAFWIARALDRVYVALDRLDARMDKLEARMERLDARVHDLGERIARLEAAHSR